ncbi:glucose-6-phosphate isomerase [Breznakia sp. PF5-3]|uniref:glucose-6-phosphate isomerase family protein n=1 Tax=unclassified Breznakia TaxID=2623764 RepID=UPI002405375C|nr:MULTISPECIES: glucose-6-phosphate isomerase family protein [unclassified Breznakia]MDL2276419.1 glucose-6-phosphate isomerase [Breznakia sp. OttesenSCG-928-G09]MDF9823805.1 glucose-6-phosphate isomerase [Breznakia sp. PM6-1]MDF9834629.1 glucose-6-phosphate isomerase [Breznakia sp. PF5-3]MDF9836754.1 glucose-6-phosphate isomerase [Breznakia sp. PFB2-8]MDF9858797.1 glucose-6-phosphate isomerase [Breznakia sp. PH5-24]
MEIFDPRVQHDFVNGIVEGKDVKISKKYYRDAKHFYLNPDASLADDTLMYQVYSYSEGNSEQVGNLNWGLTVLKPVSVNQECNMTRGHFHENLDCAEFYFGLGGEGLLLMMKEDGTCFAEKVFLNSLHHIDGSVAHRLINTGNEDLKVGACWPTIAGHDYERIEKHPFGARVFKKDDELVIEEDK